MSTHAKNNMKMEEESSNSSSELAEIINSQTTFEVKESDGLNSYTVAESSAEQDNLLVNKSVTTTSQSSFTWPSLWDNGPRRSAFQPYKPNRDATCIRVAADSNSQCTEPRAPSTTTVMTNLQRGNMQAEPTPVDNMSWFTLAGRGDITINMLQEMNKQGKDIDCVDEEALSGMMWAAYHGQIHTVQILLEAGVEVDRRSLYKETALMLAATEGHLEIVRMLIKAGADVNHEDHRHGTALMYAVYGDHPHTVSELLINGADLWVENADNNTAYDIAVTQRSHRSKAVLENYIHSLIAGS